MLMHKLRTETAGHHQELEDRLKLFERVSDLNHYISVLERFLGFIAPYEARLQQLYPWEYLGLDFIARQKTPLLMQDLNYLGKSPVVAECSSRDLPTLNNLGRVLGSFYVLEGSTLGAQVICQYFGTRLSLSPSTGLSFFYGHGEQTRPMWQAFQMFMHRMEKDHLSPQFAQQAVLGAQDTFEKLGNWLCQGDEAKEQAQGPISYQRELCSKL